MRKLCVVFLFLLGFTLVGFLFSPVHRIYLPTATGITAKQLCSLHFVSGLGIERARALYIDPLLEPALPVLHVAVDGNARQASATLLGLYRQQAVYRPGLGCTLVHDEEDFEHDLALPLDQAFEPVPVATDRQRAGFDQTALETAMERAFSGPESGARNTLALVVLHQGRVLAERYAPGIEPGTPLHGWSMTKSAMAALAGALIESGEITLDDVVLSADGERTAITLEHLLRMNSGLAMEERADGFDPNSDMLFTEADMAQWAKGREQRFAAGEQWEYMSGNTVLAAQAMQQSMGRSLTEQVEALRRHLFLPLEMHTAVLEVDQAGTFQGSSYLYASAQDWARLGQLFLQEGLWKGERLLPAGWVEQVTRPTEGAREEAYGMGFWLGHPSVEAPEGIYYMSGFQGQYAIIVPSHQLVVVRLGASNGTGTGTFQLVLDIIDAMRSPPLASSAE